MHGYLNNQDYSSFGRVHETTKLKVLKVYLYYFLYPVRILFSFLLSRVFLMSNLFGHDPCKMESSSN